MRIALNFSDLLPYWNVLLAGLMFTIVLTAVSTVVGVALGTACAWTRTFGPTWLAGVSRVYIELIRNTPFIVQLFFIFFGLPALGVKLNETTAAFLAMVINLGAYSAEIIRAGIQAVPKGHIEAGDSLAMSRFEIFRYIVLKQAFQKVYPALSSQIIIVMLGSSVVSQISAEDLTYAANFVQSRNFRAFEVYVVAAVDLPAARHRHALHPARRRPARVPERLSDTMSDFSFWVIFSNLLWAARWTVLLSIIAFVGGGIVGLAILFLRVSQIRVLEILTKGFIEFFQGTPLLMQLFLFFFGLALFGIEVSPWVAASLGADAVDRRISRRDLARLRRSDPERAVGGVVQPRALVRRADALRDPAAGGQDRDRADRRLLGAGGEGHGARLDHRLRRGDQGRHHAQQRDVPAVPRLCAGRAHLLQPVLSAVLVRQIPRREDQCRSRSLRSPRSARALAPTRC